MFRRAPSVLAVTAVVGGIVAVGSAPGPTVDGPAVGGIWFSADGRSLAQVGPAELPGSPHEVRTFFGVAAAGRGAVAVGVTYDGVSIDARAWTSADGRSWEPAHTGFGGLGIQVAHGVAMADGRVAIVGGEDLLAGAAWTGPAP